MRTPISCLALLITTLLSSTSIAADEHASQQSDFATVKLFFVNAYLPEMPRGPRANRGDGGLGGGGLVSAASRFETADLFLDDKLVSNIMFKHVDVSPTLNLTSGDHVFRIECDGYRDFEKRLTVLGNGSLQWLVVKLQRELVEPDPVDRDSAKR